MKKKATKNAKATLQNKQMEILDKEILAIIAKNETDNSKSRK